MMVHDDSAGVNCQENSLFLERVKEPKKEKKKKGWKEAAYCTAVSQGVIFALYLISVCLGDMTRETQIPSSKLDSIPGSSVLLSLGVSL